MAPRKVQAKEPEVRHHASYVPMMSIAERDYRWAQVRERMVVEGIDCLVMVGNDMKWGIGLSNIRYLTHIASNCGAYAFFPLVGEPVVWADLPHQFYPESRYLHTQNWVKDIRPDEGPRPVVELLREKKLDRSAIGIVGYGASILTGDVIPYTTMDYLRKELANAHLINATGILNHMRLIKSPEEISFLEKSGEITHKTLLNFIESAEPGKRENEVYADMVRTQLAEGAEAQVFIMMSSGPVMGPGNNKQLIHGNHQPTVPSARVLEKGDLIIFEMHSIYGGYLTAAEFSLYLGKRAPDELRRIHAVCVESQARLEEAMKAGATFREILEAERAPCKREGLDFIELGFHQHGLESAGPLTVVYEARAGKLGGEGKMDLVVRENMVFGCNIDIYNPKWKKDVGIVFGDCLQVTKKGGRKLSNTPTDVFEKPV